MTISVLAVLGLSPGPIYNCLRGLVKAGKTPDKFTLLIPERNEGPLPETVVSTLETFFPDTEFVCVQLPSLKIPFKELVKKIKLLNLNPTHFLILTGTTQLICSIQCILPIGVIPLTLNSAPPHSQVNLISASHNELLSTLTRPLIDEILAINGIGKISDKEKKTISIGKFKSVTIDLEEYQVSDGRLSGQNANIKWTAIKVDARCIFHVTFAWSGFQSKDAWWDFIQSESGKLRKQLGTRAIFFHASGVKNTSQRQRLKDIGWGVTK